jgi:5-oxoprolinase (ATP-hydrolysing) subunit A
MISAIARMPVLTQVESMTTIDLNADLGEGFGPWTMGDDAAMLGIVSSANIACGFHAGDPDVMFSAMARAKDNGVSIGAHPGFADLAGFGRRRLPLTLAEVERITAYQIGAAIGMAQLVGTKIRYVKAHGALSNWVSEDENAARAFARAIKAVDATLPCLVIAATASERGTLAEGLAVACEVFADRTYQPDGTLTPRSRPDAMIHDPEVSVRHVLAMLETGALMPLDGKPIPTRIDSICLHGDSAGAVERAKRLRDALQGAGYTIRAFA